MAKANQNQGPLLTPREAAASIGVSYATIKKWILSGSLKSVRTPGGHHRIAQSALAPLSAAPSVVQPEKQRILSRQRFRTVSGRNQLVGTILEVKIRGILAQVILAIGDQRITAIITADAAREMQLRKGQTAAALMKSTSVMIERVE
ncbi:MAG: helix-turn-helix transcriptional regulator [Terracidiphilus sp.]|jgi:molybdopterin-binding protein